MINKEINVRKSFDLAAAARAASFQQTAEHSLRELVDAYAVSHSNDADLRLRKWTESFGQLSAWELKSETLAAAADALVAAGYKPSSVNRDLSSLGSVYRWAAKRRLSPRGFRSPTLDVKRFPEAIRRVEVPDEVLQALLKRALGFRDRRFGVFVALLIDTGARKSELLDRSWDEVDLDRMEIHCPRTKNGMPRVLHFRPETAALIRRICPQRPKGKLVFEGRAAGTVISFRTAWLKTTADIERPDLHMHDIRHARAASLLRSGVTLGVAAQVLGHDPAVLARRYGHLENEALRRAQEQSWAPPK